MTDLPVGWRFARLDELIEEPLANGRSVPTAESGFPVLRLTAITERRISLRERKTGNWSRADAERFLVRAGDFLIARGNGSLSLVGRGGLVGPEVDPVAFPDTMIRVRPKTEVLDPHFLALVWESSGVRSQVQTSAKTTAGIFKINQKDIAAIRIPVPGLTEQQRIVALLEEHISRLDAGRMSLERIRDLAPALVDSVRERAFEGALVPSSADGSSEAIRQRLLAVRDRRYGQGAKRGRPVAVGPLAALYRHPRHWAVMSLEEVTDPVRTISYGILKPGPHVPGGVPFVRVVDMRTPVLNVESLHRTSPEIACQYARATLQADDVLVSIRGTYGRVCIVPQSLEGANITQDTARLAFLPGVDPRYANHYLLSAGVRRHLHAIARGVAVKGVNIGDLRQVPIGIPPLEEQRRIVEQVEDALSLADAATQSVTVADARSLALRRSILNAAFSGRLGA